MSSLSNRNADNTRSVILAIAAYIAGGDKEEEVYYIDHQYIRNNNDCNNCGISQFLMLSAISLKSQHLIPLKIIPLKIIPSIPQPL